MILDSSTAISWGWDIGEIFRTMWDAIAELLMRMLIGLASLVYNVVNIVYQVFLTLAQTNIFTEADYKMLSNRIYVVLGVVMLFVIAYNFLLLVIDPDKNKGGQSVEKMLKNIVITFVLIILMPSIFAFAVDIQTAILNENHIIESFFANALPSDSASIDDMDTGSNTIADGGKGMAVATFEGFFYAMDQANPSQKINYNEVYNLSYEDSWKFGSVDCSGYQKCTLAQALAYAKENGEFKPLYAFTNNIRYGFELGKTDTIPAEPNTNGSKQLSYNWLLATLAGAYLVYVIVNFCFDLGVRVVKLAFYQIIAPLTISCRILPNKESVFNNWMKQTISTYISVFLRVFIMQLGVYLINVFTNNLQDGRIFPETTTWPVRAFATAFIILGIVTFIKTASDLICKLFGLEVDGGLGLGLKDKFAAGGGFALAAGVGSMVTSGVRNAVSAKKRGTGFLRGAASTIAGMGSGAVRGVYQGRNAQSWSQMMSAAGNAAEATTTARDNRLDRIHDRQDNNQSLVGAAVGAMGAGITEWATAGDRTQERAAQAAAEREKAEKAMKATAEELVDKMVMDRDFYSALFQVEQSENFGLFKKLSETVGPNGEPSDKAAAIDYYQQHASWSMGDYQRRLEALSNGEESAYVDRSQFVTYDQDRIRAAAEAQIDRSQFIKTGEYQAAQEAAAAAISIEDFKTSATTEGGIIIGGGIDMEAYNKAVADAKASVNMDAFIDTDAYEKKIQEVTSSMDLSSFELGIDEAAYTKAVQEATNAEIRTITNVTGSLKKAATEKVQTLANSDYAQEALKDANGNVVLDANGQTVTIQAVLEPVIKDREALSAVHDATIEFVNVTARTVKGDVYEHDPITGERIQEQTVDANGNVVTQDKAPAHAREWVSAEDHGTLKAAKDAHKFQTQNDRRVARADAAARSRREARRANRKSDKK